MLSESGWKAPAWARMWACTAALIWRLPPLPPGERQIEISGLMVLQKPPGSFWHLKGRQLVFDPVVINPHHVLLRRQSYLGKLVLDGGINEQIGAFAQP